jgi:subtilisin family serine protease
MKKRYTIFILAILSIFLAFAAPVTAQANTAEAPFTIVFDRDNLPADVEGLVAVAGGELLFWFPEVGIAVANGDVGSFADSISADASVSEVGLSGMWSVPDVQVFAPTTLGPTVADNLYFPFQWHIRRIGADQAWANGNTGSHNTVVGIIDTGVENTHPDLAPNLVYEACVQLAGFCPPGTLTHWHGTHVAGTVAAAFDNGSVVGVGPDLGLAAYQVFEPGGSGAYDGPIWWSIIDAAYQGFQVINMSLGGYDSFGQSGGAAAASWTAWNRVVNYAVRNGVTIVASAGNAGVDVNGSLYHIPGDLSGIINVAATGIQPFPVFPQPDYFDIQAFYSNRGAAVTIAAPGGDCGEQGGCSGVPDSGYPFYWHYLVMSTYWGGSYAWSGGTSMASPHVAGVAGLVMDANPGLNPHQVRSILTRTADQIGSRLDFGHGIVDAAAAANVANK